MASSVLPSAVRAVRLVRSARSGADGFVIPWEQWPVPGPAVSSPPGPAVTRLRRWGRILAGFLDPVADSLYLCAALRHLGYAATFHVGRELVAADIPAGYLAWVQVGSQVISTSLPVREQYVEVLRYPPTP